MNRNSQLLERDAVKLETKLPNRKKCDLCNVYIKIGVRGRAYCFDHVKGYFHHQNARQDSNLA